jgi:hypothetical protein
VVTMQKKSITFAEDVVPHPPWSIPTLFLAPI